MTATRRVVHPVLSRLLVAAALAVGLTVPLAAAGSMSASAAVPAAVGARAVVVAAGRQGTPYRVGATGPRAFDCSGLTRWSYAQIGKKLPRTAQAQWAATIHIKAADRRPGDLVFFFHGRHAYHVGIYAGQGYIWHAPRPGKKVVKVRLWTSKVKYGRVR